MASLKFVLFLSVGLQGFALTSSAAGLQSVPDATRLTGDVCQDCTQIFELLEDLLSSKDLEKKMIDGFESLCDHLPAATARLCREEVEKMLPMAISFITGVVDPAEVCKIIGLCGSCDKQEKMLSYFVKEALQAAVTTENGQPATQCSFCIFLLKTLEDLLPKDRTETHALGQHTGAETSTLPSDVELYSTVRDLPGGHSKTTCSKNLRVGVNM
ncbi:putative prosaposin-like isoform 3 [Scophthalmus maximus]|uniref:Putative prosaposin-like isoform 3 n=1 Tax=Scophthalmus maximus TaxID=52904 RepID=A0A2U9CHH9_SCOMX|nr:putative prosaposin-like isoform 3 [Scophthalmus maximus]